MSELDSPAEVTTDSQSWEALARASGREAESANEALLELLTLRLGDSTYAIPVERVREIIRLRPITPVPRVPKVILGAVALRGEIVQVVDVRIRLGLAKREVTRENRLIILHGDDDRVAALLVDSVSEVLHVSAESLRPAQGASGGFVSELAVRGTEFVSIIDVERVLDLDAE